MLTKQEITHPRGQKFAIGVLVKLIEDDRDDKAGTLFRVLGTYHQRCSGHVRGSIYGPKALEIDEDSYEFHSLFKSYDLVNAETGYSSAWYDEDDLELVPEAA